MNLLFLIKALLNIDNYNNYRKHIKLKKDEDKEIYYLFVALDNIIKELKRSVTFEEYALWVQVNLGNDYTPFINAIKIQENSDQTLILKTLQIIKKKNIALEIAQKALTISEGNSKNEAELHELISKLTEDSIEDNKLKVVDFNLKSLYDTTIKSPGIRWRLDCLNRSLGPLRKGDFGFVFARPETGKTTFLASEVSFFAEQVSTPGIWINNEEAGEKVALRCITSSLGIEEYKLEQNLDFYNEQYKKNTKNNIILVDEASIHKQDIEALVEQYKPSFLVFDQIDKIKGFSEDREDLRLGKLYIWSRELAKKYCPVIGVCQADGSGENKKYLTMENVANAKTAKQAEADWILGIGATHNAGFEFIRHFNISKNKLLGDKNTDKKLRHGKFDVLIQPDIARYKDI